MWRLLMIVMASCVALSCSHKNAPAFVADALAAGEYSEISRGSYSNGSSGAAPYWLVGTTTSFDQVVVFLSEVADEHDGQVVRADHDSIVIRDRAQTSGCIYVDSYDSSKWIREQIEFKDPALVEKAADYPTVFIITILSTCPS